MVPTPPEGLVVITGSLALFVYAERPVKLEALIAGKAPDNFDAVNVEILASATVPVKLPAGIAVRLAPLIAGKVPVSLLDARAVILSFVTALLASFEILKGFSWPIVLLILIVAPLIANTTAPLKVD